MPGARNSTLPLEVLSYIVRGVDDLKTLRNTALANTALVRDSQKRIFEIVVIGGERTATPELNTVTGSARNLLDAFDLSPRLADFVQVLVIQGQALLDDEHLPSLLPLFKNVRQLNISQRYDESIYQKPHWCCLPEETRDALTTFIRRNSLQQVRLANLRDVPVAVLEPLSHVDHMVLSHCSFDCEDMPVSRPPPNSALRILDIEGYNGDHVSTCVEALVRAGFDLSLLEDFRYRDTKMHISMEGGYIDAVQRVVDLAGKSLKRFSIRPDRRMYQYDTISVHGGKIGSIIPRLNACTSLESVSFEMWTGNDAMDQENEGMLFQPVTWISWVLASLANSSSTLKHIRIDLTASELFSGSAGSDVMPDPGFRVLQEWSRHFPHLEAVEWFINALEDEDSTSWVFDDELYEEIVSMLSEEMTSLHNVGKLVVEPISGPAQFYVPFDGLTYNDDLYRI